MDRLFLDANVLFSAAYKIDARLLPLWKVKNVIRAYFGKKIAGIAIVRPGEYLRRLTGNENGR
jgi:hypothetical protein